jgi:hypothetical protein
VLQNAPECYAMVDPALFVGFEPPACDRRVPVLAPGPLAHQAGIHEIRGTKIAVA